MRVGDVANAVAVANVLVFCVLAVAGPSVGLNLFSAGFQKDGFCTSFKDTAFQSHALSFYGDVMFAGLLWLIARKKKGSPGFFYMEKGPAGILGHGFGHLYLYFKSENFGEETLSSRQTDPRSG